jgi:hypothetical protein
MEISFFNPQDYDGNVKATIHTTGKLGFTDAAIKNLRLSEKKGMKIGRNVADSSDKNLYVVFTDEVMADTFKINKAGAYYYVSTKALFDNMELAYKDKRISFEIVPITINGVTMYKFVYKEKIRSDDKELDDQDNSG